MKTLEEVIETIRRNCLSRQDVDEIVGIFEYPTYDCYQSFFKTENVTYKVLRHRKGMANNDVATQFFTKNYLQPVLDLLNSEGLALLSPGKTCYQVEKGAGSIYPERDYDVGIDFLQNNKVRLKRSDRSITVTFDSLETLLKEAFAEPKEDEFDKWDGIREKLSVAISEKYTSFSKAVKRAEATLKTVKEHFSIIEEGLASVPPEIRLLIEMGELK